jgi:CheY-like chemotaxis protein/HPt (histidine-containing phosphotransfer) domain-containing protein
MKFYSSNANLGTAIQKSELLPLRILLVEDDYFNEKVALRFLMQIGYQADVAGQGLEALEALRQHLYDVVLMDVQMPEMNGLETTQLIRQEWESDCPWIIALTGETTLGDHQLCLSAGMNDYLRKPLQPVELVAALSRFLFDQKPNPQHPPVPLSNYNLSDRHSDLPTLDLTVFQFLKEMSGEKSAIVLSDFANYHLSEFCERLQVIRLAIELDDALEVRKVAGILKLSSTSLGAVRFSRLCRELEIIAQMGSVESCVEKVQQLEAERQQIKGELEKILEEAKQPQISHDS